MQAIYSDGVGDVKKYIDDGTLIKIDKEDNYRCSQQVIDFINPLRNDSLKQEVALKKKSDGTIEIKEDRQGSVEFYYAFAPEKSGSSPEEKAEYKSNYIKYIDALILSATKGQDNYRQLKLTNKSIASDAGFGKLYEIFDNRFTDNNEAFDRELGTLQFADLFELCDAYNPHPNAVLSPNYNLVLAKLKKQQFSIKTIKDKVLIKENFDIIINSELGAIETLNKAFELGILKKSEQYLSYLERKEQFISELSNDTNFQSFKKLYHVGKNTLTRIKDDIANIDQYTFDELENNVKKERFYKELFSNDLKFKEIINYFNYQNEYTPYITMHKTKGSGIDNVLVVLDEYFWHEYNFKSIFSANDDQEKKYKNQKLFYVACSRAKKNLRCIRLVSDQEEEKMLLNSFPRAIKIDNLTKAN